jgi:hypothetical protein
MSRLLSLSCFVCVLVLSGSVSFAQEWPNGPEEDPQLAPPNDPGFDGQWNLWSFIPQEWIDANPGISQWEIDNGTGIHADRAWQRTIGDRSVIVAVLDSGIRWDSSDLLGKHYLNKAELEEYKPAKADASEDDWDVNGDGVFNVYDYLHADEAFGDDKDLNENGVFDPGDLIALASDGVDADENGFIDDISGWDFMWNDNDPFDDTDFGHGTGEAKDSVSEGNNNNGDIGVCPECSLLNLRVGDSFVVDANDFAEGTIYAVDMGAHLIQEALGSINNTRYSQEAIEYAYANNVTVVASAADELSFHHNFPGTNNHTVYVHAIVYNGPKKEKSTTFLNFNNCTNFGGQLVLSTPGTGCSSEATGISAGHVGLIYSAAVQANLSPELSSEEVRSILIMSADDIDVEGSDSDPDKFPSGPGWDLHFGYGRNNARASVDMVFDNKIPPEVDIEFPRWFEILYVDRNPTVVLEGRVGTRVDGADSRYDNYAWEISYAHGVDPKVDWVVIDAGTTAVENGVIATWDVAEAAANLDLNARLESSHQNAVTVRLTASSETSEGETLTSEFRKTLFLHIDADLHDAFPIYVGSSGESSGKFADIDQDGAEELIIGTSDGWIHAFKADGSEAEGWPAALDFRPSLREDNQGLDGDFGLGNHRNACAYRQDKSGCLRTDGWVNPDVGETILGTIAIGDLTNDGDLEIVANSWDGGVYVFDHEGNRVEGFPQRTDLANSYNTTDEDHLVDHGFFAAPVLADLDGDGTLEIISAAQDQFIYVWRHDGSIQDGWPVRVRDPNYPDKSDRIISTPAVGDVNGDGLLDIVTGTNETFGAKGAENESRAYVLHGDGSLHEGGAFHEGWPIALYGLQDNVLPVVGRGTPNNPILADLDYDGTLEIAVEAISSSGFIYRYDGSIYKTLNNQEFGEGSPSEDSPLYMLINNSAFARFDNEGGIDILKGGAGFGFAKTFVAGGNRVGFDHHLGAWDTLTGKFLDQWPQIMEDWQFFMNPVVVDMDGDNKVEAINSGGGYLVHAWNSDAVEPTGWPKTTGGWNIASAAVGDIDGDGGLDVSVSNREGWVFAWKTSGSSDGVIEWASYAHDHHNTNNYNTPIPLYGASGSGPVIEPGEEGGEEEDVVEGVDVEINEDAEGTGEEGAGTEVSTSGDSDGGGCSSRGSKPFTPMALVCLMGLMVWCTQRRRHGREKALR